MQARPGPAYKPEDYRHGYSRDQIVGHLDECLSIYAELDAEHEIAPEIAPLVFSIITTMEAAIEPTEETMKKLGARSTILGVANGDGAGPLGIVGRG